MTDGLRKAYLGLLLLAVFIILVCSLSGCSVTRKSVCNVRDSVVIVHRDSMVYRYKDSVIVNVLDSVRLVIRDSVVIVKAEDGRIISKESYHITDSSRDRNTIQESMSESNEVSVTEGETLESHDSETEITKEKVDPIKNIKVSLFDFAILVSIILVISFYIRKRFFS